MQDIHAIGGGVAAAAGGGGGAVGGGVAAGSGGRLFAGGDRRLRPHHNQNQQALKCPRCDSLNTKFCYYNNYNLSQPRHFCKSCRRYWTKGGVLRNVPVGGGCRKTKRSKPKQQSVSSSDGGGATTSTTVAPVRERNSNSHSSSESSSLTATTTAAKNTATATGSSGEVASATVNSSNTPTNLINFPDSRFFMPQINTSSGFDQQQQQPAMIDPSGTSNGHIFHDIGTFTNLMTSSNDGNFLGFNMAADISTTTTTATAYRLQQQQEDHHHNHHAVEDQCSNPMVGSTGEDEMKMEPINCGFLDQTAHIGFTGLHQSSRMSNGGLAGLDWQINGGGGGGGVDQSLFDFTGTVDQTIWGHQWTDNDQSLNFPPLV